MSETSEGKAAHTPCVGVLFVHGAGDHGVGATLTEFGQPVVAWLDGWLSGGAPRGRTSAADRARPGAAQILVREADEAAPAHVAVELRSRRDVDPHVWLLAESRWDEAFTPPAFKQVLLWALSVVPWTILTQFIGPLADESRLLRPTFLSILRFFWNIAFSAVLAFVAAIVLQAVAIVILVLSIIPLDPVRDLVGKLQRFASSSVGDLYLVLSSPIERAALAGAVQRDVDWLREQGCERVIVIAHSQGGFVAHEALTDPWHRKIEGFITFGSGLIRLTESEEARRTGMLLPALVGVVGALIAVRFAPETVLGALGLADKHQASALAFEIGSLMAAALVIPIRRYRRDKLEIEPLPEPVPWIDYVTNEDPVLNGSRVGRLPPSARKVRIVNRASVIADHGSYWQNTDQFVSRVALRIGRLDPDLRLMCAGPQGSAQAIGRHLRNSWLRREQRVAVLERARVLISAATVAILAIRLNQLEAIGNALSDIVGQVPYTVISWLPGALQQILPIATSNAAIVGGVVVVVSSLIGYKILVAIWDAWGRSDTAAQWAGKPPDRQSTAVWTFYAWITIHLAAIVAVAIVGPRDVLTGIGYLWDRRDDVVQAWARLYAFSVLLGFIASALSIDRVTRRIDESRLAVIIAGTGLALLMEFPLAAARPGPTEPAQAIVIGLLIEILALIIVILLVSPIGRLIRFLNSRIPKAPEVPSTRKPVATAIDQLGVAGLLGAAIGIPLANQIVPVAALVGALCAFAGLMATGALVLKGSSGQLRVVGGLGAAFSLAVLVFGIGRVIGLVTG